MRSQPSDIYATIGFTLDEQRELIACGLANLRASGAENVCAFRAGNYGANFDTLKALTSNGVKFDSSYNFPYLGSYCGMSMLDQLTQPQEIHGVLDYPITCFRDWPGHYRSAQLCAVSKQELEGALLQAWKSKWSAFVIVFHSFELIRRRPGPKQSTPDPVVIRRFDHLCGFLEGNRDKFVTRTFSDINGRPPRAEQAAVPLSSRLDRTLWRYLEQTYRRLTWAARKPPARRGPSLRSLSVPAGRDSIAVSRSLRAELQGAADGAGPAASGAAVSRRPLGGL